MNKYEQANGLQCHGGHSCIYSYVGDDMTIFSSIVSSSSSSYYYFSTSSFS